MHNLGSFIEDRVRRATAGGLGTVAVLAGLAVSALAPAAALAATYYVRADGSDSNAGTGNSATGAWRTIAKANTVVRAGDVVNVVSLNVADTASTSSNRIAPSTGGSTSAPIYYIGDVADPTRLGVPNISLNVSNVVVRGFRSRGDADISAAGGGGDRCVIERCHFSRGLNLLGATNSRVSDNTLRVTAGTDWVVVLDSRNSQYQGVPASYDTLRNNRFDFGTIQDGGRTMMIRFGTHHCLLEGNRITGAMDNSGRTGTQETYALVLYECNDVTFRGNRIEWDVRTPGYEANGSGVPWNALVLRSGARNNLFHRDTLIVRSPNRYQARLSLGQVSAGATDPPWQTSGNRWVGCFYKVEGGTIVFQHQFLDGVIDSCVFATTSAPALSVNLLGNSKIRNNTFVSGVSRGVWFEGSYTAAGNEFRNNIIVSTSPACTQGVIDSDPSVPSGMLASNHNLFFATSGSSGNAVSNGGVCSAVGAGTNWCNSSGNDCNSLWQNPQFVSGSFANLDVTLLPTSPAIGRAADGGDLGAIQYTVDTVAPSAVTNLAAPMVSDRNATLAWTAPGDNGNLGTATAYDLRMSTAPITELNFGSATVVPAPAPAGAGTSQNVTVTGLTPGIVYYFALRARDESNNWSPLGNVLVMPTPLVDPVAPKPVGDLSAN